MALPLPPMPSMALEEIVDEEEGECVVEEWPEVFSILTFAHLGDVAAGALLSAR